MQNWEVKFEGPGQVSGVPKDFVRRQGYLVHEIPQDTSESTDVIDRHETNPAAHFTIDQPPEFVAYISGLSLEEVLAGKEAPIVDGHSTALQTNSPDETGKQ